MSRSIDLSLQLPGVSFIEGSTIDATVRTTAERDVMVEGGRVELVRTMTYRYTAWSPYASPITIPARGAKGISQAHFHPAGPLLGGRPLLQPVALDIPPEGPGSVQTELVDISWAVQARLHLANSRDVEATTPIVVLSQARDCAPVADAPPVLEAQGCAVLGFESLSSRRLAPGVPLSGVLTVAPLRSAAAREIRLDLVLLEHVRHGTAAHRRPRSEPGPRGQVRRDRGGQPAAGRAGRVGPVPAAAVPVHPAGATPAASPDDADAQLHLALDAPRRGRPPAAPRPMCRRRAAGGDDPAMTSAAPPSPTFRATPSGARTRSAGSAPATSSGFRCRSGC